jgi:hypothetical protein
VRTFWMRSAAMGTSPRTAYFISRSLAFMVLCCNALELLAGASRAMDATMVVARMGGRNEGGLRAPVTRLCNAARDRLRILECAAQQQRRVASAQRS